MRKFNRTVEFIREWVFHKRPEQGPSYTYFGGLVLDKEGDFPLYVGTARCSERDQFNKKLGRAIARGRAKKAVAEGAYPFIVFTQLPRTEDIREVIYNEYPNTKTDDNQAAKK